MAKLTMKKRQLAKQASRTSSISIGHNRKAPSKQPQEPQPLPVDTRPGVRMKRDFSKHPDPAIPITEQNQEVAEEDAKRNAEKRNEAPFKVINVPPTETPDTGIPVTGELLPPEDETPPEGKEMVIPSKSDLMVASSLLPYLDTLDEMAEAAQEEDAVRQLLEGYVMVDAVARERKLSEQANRAEGGVTRLRARLGALTPDGRRGRSGKTSSTGDVLTSSQQNERHQNKQLAKIGEKKVAEVADTLIKDGVRPTPRKVIETVKKPASKYTGDSSNEYYTPKHIVDAVRRVMGAIDLDPASCSDANDNMKAKKFYTQQDDGLTKPWRGRVFCNPPFSKVKVMDWVSKMVESPIDQGILLLHASTDTAYGQMALSKCDAVCFPEGRLKFYGPKAGGGAQIGQMILYYGDDTEAFYNEFSEFGVVMLSAQGDAS